MISDACKRCKTSGWCEYDFEMDRVYPAEEEKCLITGGAKMQTLDMNQFMADVHKNAVEHGWWDKVRSDGTLRSLLHCELSEAMEAHRSKEPLWWHKCPNHAGACESQAVHEDDSLHCEACQIADRKPEGAAVELMDFVIRVLDWLGQMGDERNRYFPEQEKLMNWAVEDYEREEKINAVKMELPDLIDTLHDEITFCKKMRNLKYLMRACGLAMAWVLEKGLDPTDIMLKKHEYNKTRSYKHGGKEC